MEAMIYGLIFIIGALFGSFFTLAVYRIPLGLDITHEHSFCPSCKAKLKFIDLIPIISYISTLGRCRYCKGKIRIRYLLLEILSGLVFLSFALSLNMNVFSLNINEIIHFLFFILYFAGLFIIAGIDKEKINLQKSVLFFNLILSICYMIYVCISNRGAIYTYIIFLAIIIFMLILDLLVLKKNLTQNYTLSILILSLCMIIFSGAEVYYYTVALSLLLIGITGIIERIKNNSKRKAIIDTDKNKDLKLPIGFYLVCSNIFLIIINNFLLFRF